MSELEPDRNQIEIFIDALLRYRGTEGYLSLRAFFHDNKPLAVRLWPAQLDGSYQFLVDRAFDMATRAANTPEPAVFCPPLCVFNGPNGQAREQDLFKGLVLSVECDERPKEARRKLEDVLGETTAIIRSGGQWVNGDGIAEDRLHLHWRLRLPAIGAALPKLKRARQLATAIVDGDPSNVPTIHCLRWPGSWHRKGAPRLCKFVYVNPDREIDLDMALAALEAAAPDRGKPVEPRSPEYWRTFIGQDVDGSGRGAAIARLYGLLARRFVDPILALDLVRMFNILRCKPPLDEAEVVRIAQDIAEREVNRRGA